MLFTDWLGKTFLNIFFIKEMVKKMSFEKKRLSYLYSGQKITFDQVFQKNRKNVFFSISFIKEWLIINNIKKLTSDSDSLLDYFWSRF